MRQFLVLFLSWFCWHFAIGAENSLPMDIRQTLAKHAIAEDSLSIYMAPLYGKEPIWAYRENVMMNPASTMKVLTSYAALDLLGPDYRWSTVLSHQAKIEQGVLQGDLYIKGQGDPRLFDKDIEEMLAALRERGIQKIVGDLVIDRSWLVLPEEPAFDMTPEYAYNLAPDALLFNHHLIKINAQSDGETVQITADPKLSAVKLKNDLRINKVLECQKSSVPRPIIIDTVEGKVTVRFKGEFPPYCEKEKYYQVLDGNRYAADFFALTWKKLGGVWQGKVREGKAPDDGRVLYTHYSPDLRKVVRETNKHSNNTMARLLYLRLGGKACDQPVSLPKAQTYMLRWMQGKGWKTKSVVIENGSGLSRRERLSAHLLANVIQTAMRSPYAGAFESSLPVVGVNGTMQDRLVEHEIMGRAFIKTGTLANVKAIAGTIHGMNGKRAVIVAIINQDHLQGGAEVLDEVLKHAWQLLAKSTY